MNQLSLIPSSDIALPSMITADAPAKLRFMEFFTANIRNINTRKAYARATADFLTWCEARGVTALPAIQPIHVAAWIEELGHRHSAPTVKQRLAALRHLFDWMVVGQVMPSNPAHAVRGPKFSTKKGRTPVLSPQEARQLLDRIPADTISGKRDRALLALMTYSFARVSAAVNMKVRDVYTQNRRLWVRLHEKGGKLHELPCHHSLEEYLDDYMEAAGLKDDQHGPLFRTVGRGTGKLSQTPLPRQNVHHMIRRRAAEAGIKTKIGCHTFRATGITAYLKNGGTLEKAAHIANHSSTKTTQLYDRRSDDVSLGEIERILI